MTTTKPPAIDPLKLDDWLPLHPYADVCPCCRTGVIATDLDGRRYCRSGHVWHLEFGVPVVDVARPGG